MIWFGDPITHYNHNNNHIKAYGIDVNNKLVNKMDDIGNHNILSLYYPQLNEHCGMS